ncbi:MAG: class I SAM-dependent methyltransferase [Candidatus Moranbacteria bacterium]|nr:class I SAM-dependent methyltransferase [Candidatus Moranbacteria bacterium]
MQTGSSAIERFINPLSIIRQLDVVPGNVVADFGCGAGYFSIPFAQKIGKEGKVYCLDVLPQALEAVESRAKIMGITNIITRRVNLENKQGSKLDKESVDWVVLKDILFQNQQKEAIIEEVHRVLKPQGKTLIVEWNDKDFSIGPDKKLRVSLKTLSKTVGKHKFSIEKVLEAGNFHYAMVLAKH